MASAGNGVAVRVGHDDLVGQMFNDCQEFASEQLSAMVSFAMGLTAPKHGWIGFQMRSAPIAYATSPQLPTRKVNRNQRAARATEQAQHHTPLGGVPDIWVSRPV